MCLFTHTFLFIFYYTQFFPLFFFASSLTPDILSDSLVTKFSFMLSSYSSHTVALIVSFLLLRLETRLLRAVKVQGYSAELSGNSPRVVI